jgi:hypothetical protein
MSYNTTTNKYEYDFEMPSKFSTIIVDTSTIWQS